MVIFHSYVTCPLPGHCRKTQGGSCEVRGLGAVSEVSVGGPWMALGPRGWNRRESSQVMVILGDLSTNMRDDTNNIIDMIRYDI